LESGAAEPKDAEVARLIQQLGATEQGLARAAGEELLRLGADAEGPLLEALAGGTAEQRKAAAFLLGQGDRDARVAAALAGALGDPEPKVRKNAAVGLGRLGAPEAAPALAAALAREEVLWVRPSLALALGRVGGEAAVAALQENAPRSGEESEATRKALERLVPPRGTVGWRPDRAPAAAVFASVPPGLEEVTVGEAVERGLPAPQRVAPGLLRFPKRTAPAGLLARLRCAYDVRLLLAQGPALAAAGPRQVTERLEALLAECRALADWRRWLTVSAPPLRYRFALPGLRLPKQEFQHALATVRAALARLDLADSPSHYSFQLVVEAAPETTRIWFLPTFEEDVRFAYRQEDVGAAIHPAVGACLARLVRSGDRGLVFDPTCGSATLLVERALLDPDLTLQGIDVSPTAVDAARANVAAAGLTGRIRITRADAGDAASWPAADEVLANLPFGLRSRGQDRDLEQLYASVIAHLARSLRLEGSAVLYSANVGAVESRLRVLKGRLQVRRRYRVESGGLKVGVWLLAHGM
jgi:23S rRNA G2445 N2-methylase RlmL